ncbi:hypothetical protein ACL02R_08300 [Streptomyces sp. MS19]|uniref:hypothetical protein n=1 Tax=Streptomyces sp. MS19 TaxID=3385972 RepID=UPI0039A30A0A
MRTLFDGELQVEYAQFSVDSRLERAGWDLADAFVGQRSGLCGAALPGVLHLVTGLRFGRVGLTVERHDGPPAYDDAWEEIVEVPFLPASDDIRLGSLSDEQVPLLLALDETSYRVRYCGTGMDRGHQTDLRWEGQPQVDRYLLQFWPAPTAPDQVVKQTSGDAAYWHRAAREAQPPPPREEGEAEAREAARRRVMQEKLMWRGRLPGERLRRIPGRVASDLARLDRKLVEAIDAAGPVTQRALARWAARRAYAVAGLAEADWIAPALAALDRGETLPAPFGSRHRVWERVLDDGRIRRTTVTAWDGSGADVVQQQVAIPALRHATAPDPLHAAMHALFTTVATYGEDYPALFTEVRRAFPSLAG